MRLSYVLLCAFTVGICFMRSLCVAAPTVIGLREICTVGTNAFDETVSAQFLVEGSLRKVGTGALSIPAEHYFSGSGERVDVLAGTFSITSDTTCIMALTDTPSSTLAKAAFWVDATTNVIFTTVDGTNQVSQWLDVREPDTTAPYLYRRAVSQTTFTNVVPEFRANGAGPSDALPYLWFGGYHSGRWMDWLKPDDTTGHFSNAVHHVFAVHGAHDSYGYLFGVTLSDSSTYPLDFYKDDWASDTGAEGTIWSESASGYVATAVRTGRTFLDRKQVVATATAVKRGYQLLDVEVGCRPAHAGNFFNCRNYFPGTNARVGGDRLCEVLVFTNRLTETERVCVENYLWQKWLSRAPQTPGGFGVAQGATSVVETVAGEAQTLTVEGDGVVVKKGASTAVIPVGKDLPLGAFNGSVFLEGGALAARYPVALEGVSGVRYTCTNFVATCDTAGAGKIVKAGNGELILSGIPDGTAVSVEQGILQIAQPLAARWPTEMRGVIPNPTFEGLTTTNRYLSSEPFGGWTGAVLSYPAQSSVRIMADSQWMSSGNGLLPTPTPDGTCFLLLKASVSAQTTITLPTDGVYALSFIACGRKYAGGSKDGHSFDIIIDGTNRVATVPTFATAWQAYRYRLPWLSAGDHTLLLKSVSGDVDIATALDDMRLDWVEAEPLLNIVSNACFECVASGNYGKTMSFSSATDTGWAFSSGGGGGYVNIKCQGTLFTTYDAAAPRIIEGSGVCNLQEFGRRNLFVYSDGIASTTVQFPEIGQYTLSLRVARTRLTSSDPSAASELTVSISGCVTQKLSVARDAFEIRTVGPFTAPANTPLTLQLSGTSGKCMMLVDDLQVGKCENLIRNGSFEEGETVAYTTNGWTVFIPSGAAPIVYATALGEQDNWGAAFGTNTFDGDCRCRVSSATNANGYVKQTVNFAAGGTYRLTFHATSRTQLSPAYGTSLRGCNPMKVWIARDGVTNDLAYVTTSDDQFRRYEDLFSIAAAGDYEIGFEGQAMADRTSLIDAVSVVKVSVDETWSPFAKNIGFAVASGAKLHLNFVGSLAVESFVYNGRALTGDVNSATYPEIVLGSGTLHCVSRGTLLSVR